MDVSFIGSGNLAWHLAPALDNTDYPVREVYSRNERNAEALAERLYDAGVQSTLDFSDSSSRIFIVAVPDDAISDIVAEVVLPAGAILLHTSGSQPLDALSNARTDRTGVFYPLQTFTKGRKIDMGEVPVFVEGNDKETEQIVFAMAKSVSGRVYRMKSHERRVLHMAAVFASNFTNHMLTLSRDIMLAHGLDYELLKPLILETIGKSLTAGPEQSQTGPAKRGDLETLDKHMELLGDDPALSEIYRVISQHIVDRYT